MGFVRRDFGAAGLYDLGLGSTEILVALVTITLFVPCIASVLVIMKERGKAFTAFTWVGSVVLAFTRRWHRGPARRLAVGPRRRRKERLP